LATRAWAAWNLPLWHVRQVMLFLTAEACARCEWHDEHTNFLVMLLACCALAAGPLPPPL
jgi:hypothetical protein